jgi:1-acyl-sn-glycerol-3-phosphate acyltransferase
VSPKGSRWYFFILWIARHILLRFFSGGIKIIDQRNVPLEGPVILAPNHVSFFDPPVVACASPRALTFMAKEELFKPPVFGPLIKSVNAHPLKRGAGDTSAIRLALEKLGEGHCLIMFPEGTRGDGKVLGEMQSGVAMLAKRSGARVVPVGVYGTHKVLPKGKKWPRFSRIRIVFGQPFTYADCAVGGDDKATREAFNSRLEKEIVGLCQRVGLSVRTASGRAFQTEPGLRET